MGRPKDGKVEDHQACRLRRSHRLCAVGVVGRRACGGAAQPRLVPEAPLVRPWLEGSTTSRRRDEVGDTGRRRVRIHASVGDAAHRELRLRQTPLQGAEQLHEPRAAVTEVHARRTAEGEGVGKGARTAEGTWEGHWGATCTCTCHMHLYEPVRALGASAFTLGHAQLVHSLIESRGVLFGSRAAHVRRVLRAHVGKEERDTRPDRQDM